MSSETTKTYTFGPGFLGLLTLLFIALKLTNVIAWSWLWVLAPLWVLPAIFSALAILFGIAYGIAHLVYVARTTPEQRKRDKALKDVSKQLKRMGR